MMMTRLKRQICVFYRNLVEAHKILLLRIIPRQRKRPRKDAGHDHGDDGDEDHVAHKEDDNDVQKWN